MSVLEMIHIMWVESFGHWRCKRIRSIFMLPHFVEQFYLSQESLCWKSSFWRYSQDSISSRDHSYVFDFSISLTNWGSTYRGFSVYRVNIIFFSKNRILELFFTHQNSYLKCDKNKRLLPKGIFVKSKLIQNSFLYHNSQISCKNILVGKPNVWNKIDMLFY